MSQHYLMKGEPTRFTKEYLDQVLLHCVSNNASDITIQTSESIIAEIHGKLYRVTKRALPHPEVCEIINTIYGPNATTQILSGDDVDTHYEIRPSRHERYRFRINGTGCLVEGMEGIQITARSIPSEPPNLENMDLDPAIVASMAPYQGIIYVTGATGSGKSTLLAAMIKNIAQDSEGHRKILTYEAPIEFVYDSVDMPNSVISQSEIPRHLPTFAAGVRNALRRKPRLILVGEARDQETIAAAIEAALTGHPVYTTLHSNGVAETLRRLVTTFPAEERAGRIIDILETIRLVIWQRLVPTVDGKRVALREYLVFNEEIRDRLLETPPEHVIATTRQLVKEKGQPMIKDAQKKFDAGIISEREYKVLAAGAKSADRDAGLK